VVDIIIKKDVRIKSPIDGSIITTRRQLSEHNKKHNVVQTGEFGSNNGEKFFDRKKKERDSYYASPEAKKERVKDLLKSYDKESNR
tara:strand:+ start:4863 stop:5120 length:258 start_codon:yes stop_codon:yes gene_type:complete